jgi:Transposase DDE domain
VEGQLWKLIVAVLAMIDKRPRRASQDFSDEEIVQVFYWSVIHDRPISWACQPRNWPLQLRRRSLPSNTTMSRRLRSASVVALLDALERRVSAPRGQHLYWMIDGKPLVVSGCSKDRQAGYGRAARSKAKGYKIHAIVAADGSLANWRIAPMNKDERVMAERMLKTTDLAGYIVADANYDSNKIHKICEARGNRQFVSPRRYGSGRKVGHRAQSPGRLRSIALLENPEPHFGRQLLKDRAAIERHFGNATNWGGGLTHLPPWARTHRRVRRWVQAKLTLTALRRSKNQYTYVKS